MNKNKYVGQKFGRLVILKYSHRNKHSHPYYICKCDCGNIKTINIYSLKSGLTKSCGCYNKEQNTKHGMSRSPEHKAWYDLNDRCYNQKNKKYKDYGGRGIRVCERWKNSFVAFQKDMGPRPSKQHSVERIDNDKGYEPDNCKWATRHTQTRNRRSNRWINIGGVSKIQKDWLKFLGKNLSSIYSYADYHNISNAKSAEICIKKWFKQKNKI